MGSVQRNHRAGQYTGEEKEEEEEEEDLICFPLRFGGASIGEEGGEIRNGDTERKEDFDKCEREGGNRQVLKLFNVDTHRCSTFCKYKFKIYF